MSPQGQVNPNIYSMLADDVACRVKIMCVNDAFCPGINRIKSWTEKGIDKFLEDYLDIRIDGIMTELEGFSDDEMPDEDEIKLDARLTLLGHYYEEAESYKYEVEEYIVENIINEMKANKIRKDEDFISFDFRDLC